MQNMQVPGRSELQCFEAKTILCRHQQRHARYDTIRNVQFVLKARLQFYLQASPDEETLQDGRSAFELPGFGGLGYIVQSRGSSDSVQSLG